MNPGSVLHTWHSAASSTGVAAVLVLLCGGQEQPNPTRCLLSLLPVLQGCFQQQR